ncbi:MAG: GAF domain-containing sensor histidine kinase [Magnetococcus sp. DMHC-6]
MPDTKTKRALIAITSCNRAIIRSTHKTELIQKICHIIVEQTGYRMVWMGVADHGPEKKVIPIQQCGFDEGYLESIQVTWDNSETGLGPTGTAIRTKKTIACRNILEDPNYQPWRNRALERGYRSSIAIPLQNPHGLLGALNIYAEEADAFDTEEIAMLETLANDLAYGLYFLEVIEQKNKAEQKLKSLNKNLKKIVRERTHDLRNTNHELESFAHTVSHDLRAPLRHISGFLNILLDNHLQSLDTQGLSLIKIILKSVDDMNARIEGLIRLARFNRSPPRRAPIDFTALCHNSIAKLNADHKKRPILHINIAEGMQLQAEERLIQTLMDNLIENAWKFSAHQTNPKIEIGSLSNNGETIYFVKDNGIGFDMRLAKKLFQPFQRLHPSLNIPGEGIGLATVKKIVRLHNGRIWTESKPNTGTTFWFTLEQDALRAKN